MGPTTFAIATARGLVMKIAFIHNMFAGVFIKSIIIYYKEKMICPLLILYILNI